MRTYHQSNIQPQPFLMRWWSRYHTTWYKHCRQRIPIKPIDPFTTLQWRHNKYDDVSNHHPHDYLRNRVFRHRSKKTSKLRVTGLCVENSSVTSEFLAQKGFHLMTSSWDVFNLVCLCRWLDEVMYQRGDFRPVSMSSTCLCNMTCSGMISLATREMHR